MKLLDLSKRIVLPMVLCATCVAPMMLCAQDDGKNGPPEILVVQREFTRPGRAGMAHEKTEGQFARELESSKGEFYYFALTSMSGPDRALFLSGYSSLADWESTAKGLAKHPAMMESMDRVNMADGDLLSSADSSVWRKRDDMSMNTHDLKGQRFFQIEQFKLKPGHHGDWEEAVKMVMDGYKKGMPEASWAMFEQVYGTGGDAFIVVETMKSLAEVDEHHAAESKFADAMGKDGLMKLDKLVADCVESEQTNLFAINPRMSHVPEEWRKGEPDFWMPKTTTTAKKAAAAPAQ